MLTAKFDIRYSIFDQKTAGFTLIEIVIVLFLVTLILGFSSVYFSGSLASVRIHSTGREVLATMRYARSMARMNHEKQILTIDLDAKHYGIEGHGSRNIPQEIRIRILDPFSGEIANGKYSMVFPSSGAIRGGTIILSNNRKELSILTDPVIGSVIKGKDSGNKRIK